MLKASNIKKSSSYLFLFSLKVGKYYLPVFCAASRTSARDYFHAVCGNFKKADGNRVTLYCLGAMHVKRGFISTFDKPEKLEVYNVA